MTDQDLTKYYEILELDSDASEEDITRAYQYLKKLYSKTSMATAPVDDEWDKSDKQEILKQVEEAYVKLLNYAPEEEALEEEPMTVPEEEEYEAAEVVEEPADESKEYMPQEEPIVTIEFDEEEPVKEKEETEKKAELFDSYVEEEVLFVDLEEEKGEEEEPEEEKGVDEDDTLAEKFVGGVDGKEINGAVLKEIRESQEWSLQDMADSTQVPIDMLEYIEAEEFGKIPDAGYLRWYVTTYAKTLSLPNPKEVADQYMKHYRNWLKEQD
jgi:hypothetical protein